MVIRVGSSPILHTKKYKYQNWCLYFFCFKLKVYMGLELRRKLHLYAICASSPNSSHLLFVGYGRTGESPILHTKKYKYQNRCLYFFCFKLKVYMGLERLNPLAGDGNPFVDLKSTFPLIGEFPILHTKKDDKFQLVVFFIQAIGLVCKHSLECM